MTWPQVLSWKDGDEWRAVRLDLIDGRVQQVGEIQDGDDRMTAEGAATPAVPRPIETCVVCGELRPGGGCARHHSCGGCSTRKERTVAMLKEAG